MYYMYVCFLNKIIYLSNKNAGREEQLQREIQNVANAQKP